MVDLNAASINVINVLSEQQTDVDMPCMMLWLFIDVGVLFQFFYICLSQSMFLWLCALGSKCTSHFYVGCLCVIVFQSKHKT